MEPLWISSYPMHFHYACNGVWLEIGCEIGWQQNNNNSFVRTSFNLVSP